jgi:Gas vesicle synthesis protein GvpL/GvpF
MARGTYVYGLVQSARAPSLAEIPAGLAGAGPPRALAVGRGRWVIAADVPLDRYGEAPLARGLRDLDWVGACALAHEAVVESLVRRGPVVPMKLFTIFRSDERAIDHLKGAARTVDRAFRRVAGASEWSVRVFRAAEAPAAQTVAGSGGEIRSGADFLRRKKQVRDEAHAAARIAAAAADAAHRALKKIARASVVKPPVAGETRARLIVDAAYLVPDARRAAFRTEAKRQEARCRTAGCTLTLTGPWPAYHFIQEQP